MTASAHSQFASPSPCCCFFVCSVNGAGGNREGQSSQWRSPLPPWSVSRSPGPGLGTLRVVNGTTLHWSFAMQTDLANAMQSGGMPVLTDEAYFYARV